MKPSVKELACFEEVAGVIGEREAERELFKAVNCGIIVLHRDQPLEDAFLWDDTPQKYKFWYNIWNNIWGDA